MKFTDTHTHIYASEFDEDRTQVVQNAVSSGVTRLFMPAIDSGYHEKMLLLCNGFPQYCFPMMGLHPTSVDANYKEELEIAGQYLANPDFRFYAIGEVGIDLYWDKTFREEQEKALEIQFDLAIRYNLPLAIHTRNSMDLVLEMVEKRNNRHIRGVFHCFGGNYHQAQRAVAAGFMLGIGGVVTYKNSGLKEVVEKTDLAHLVIETDAPWLPPVPHRGQRNEPAYVPLIAGKIAEIKQVEIEKVAEITQKNAEKLFQINIY